MIPVFKPSVGEEELDALRESFSTGWLGLGPKTKQFESEFAGYLGIKFAVGTSSATAALHLALKALNIEGGEVITTAMTFVSTNHAILYNNAIPVFADIEEDTLNIDVAEIERLIGPRTKAIMVVHYGGHACDMDPILDLAKAKGVAVVEDAAHACGGEYKQRKLGTLGEFGCFSFHAVKNLTTGEGGMIVTSSEDLAERLRALRWLGITRSTYERSGESRYAWEYTVAEVGFKAHMNDIAASIGLVQLRKLDALNARRRQIVTTYNKAFSQISWVSIPAEKPYARSALHNYVIKVPSSVRDDLISFLADCGIAASVHYFPNHLYSAYAPFRKSLPVTERVWKRLITLPLYPDLTPAEIDHIIATVQEFGRSRCLQ
ncbi:MAG: pyridoxal-5'-phosphate-dependent protein [Latescibacteria bacterium DG_63]|nr:MAG: pyridoxal-5'-phosphate-dependent protein [Latescibacteria bacterium DG_63]